MPPAPALVVLDLAGTTVRDRGEVPDAFVSALAEHGLRVTKEELVSVRGARKRDAVLRFVPEGGGREERAAAAYASFQEQLARRYRESAAAIPGAEEAIAALRARGIRVALNTGFDRAITELLLSALGWDRVADAVVCGDDAEPGALVEIDASDPAGAHAVAGAHPRRPDHDPSPDLRLVAEALREDRRPVGPAERGGGIGGADHRGQRRGSDEQRKKTADAHQARAA
jgi:beta-phosphoglucomutase-like phosphatase (HAD superfamily)